MSIAMYSKYVTLDTHTHTHRVYPRSAMGKWAFTFPRNIKFACKHFHCANHSPYNPSSC